MLGPRLELRQSQALVMTPQLRLAIQLLQFSSLDVAAFVEAELERNPLLERDETSDLPDPEAPAPDQQPPGPAPDGRDSSDIVASGILPDDAPLDAATAAIGDPGGPADGDPSFGEAAFGDAPWGAGGGADFAGDERGIDAFAAAEPTLRERLAEQIRLGFADPADRLIAAQLLALLEPSGRLGAAPAAIAQALGLPLERVERVRAAMLRFEPTGMFACSLAECLAVQLAERNRLDPAMQTLLDNLELLARRDLRRLMELCGVDAEDMTEMVAELRRLDPKPGAVSDLPAAPIVPDVLLSAAPDGTWLLELNPETLPRLLVNHGFSARVQAHPAAASREDRAFLAEKLQTANWLVKSLQQRAQTILKVAGEIVARQDGFFRHGVLHLRPLILRDIAAAVQLHESTVSRVTSNKYIATPRGNFELKYFFTTAIASAGGGEAHSAEAIRHRIRAMVGAEKPDDILSDDAIVAALRGEGVDIARRTVAKYREALNIPSSLQRRREKAPLAP
ncbi:MAG: RNA polymerase factor sigma-54 [Rhodospirillales bacterium]|nr:RNA polymerase factor sigma-54 [Rhodospirillales bacterium]